MNSAHLSTSHKQKFEQIRAQWEAAQPSKPQQASRMPGRKARPSEAPQPLDSDNDGQNRKLRRFSSIASFMSPPSSFVSKAFSRRKQPRNSAAGSASMTALLSVGETQGLLSPSRQSSEYSSLSPTKRSPSKFDPVKAESEWLLTPKTLSRSQTMSNIPVPTKSCASSGAHSITQSRSSTSLPRSPRSRIPTPMRNAKHVAAGRAFARTSDSPSQTSQRSHMTPNLLVGVKKPMPTFMVPRKAIYKERPLGTPTVTKTYHKENVGRPSKLEGYYQLEDRTTRRDTRSLAANEGRQSMGPKAKGKQPVRSVPLLAEITKKNTNERAQTPVTVKRYQQPSKSMTKLPSLSSVHEITQVKLMGPRNPPTPPQPRTPGAPPVPNLDIIAIKNKGNSSLAIRKKSHQGPLSDGGTPSQASSRLVREVRSLSNLVPSVPRIPTKYGTPLRKKPLSPNPTLYITPLVTTPKDHHNYAEPANTALGRQVSQVSPESYWCGRFMRLSDLHRNADFGTALRPIDSASSSEGGDSSDEKRDHSVFKELSELCVTTEAKESLRVGYCPTLSKEI
ncbi:hypothetical protein K432DRAFT_455082 [Lepidopterella palustris CBS 459.81]|uniref:Uncharacterized protein n=1 Tax=Lepidopterella palustris CBS 459.81 TaxID=1314670 RepID=A0A8E2JL10_9PEZI|nr:hypothetical protein K432DRAFT_455082 [Lepidopterella palustris CBS 459.81]